MRGLLVTAFVLLLSGSAAAAPEVTNQQSANTGAYVVVHESLVQIKSSNGSGTASCSGSIIESDDTGSSVLTAAHCVEGYSSFRVILHEDIAHAVAARLIRAGSSKDLQSQDGEGDLALLRIDVPHLKPLRVADHAVIGSDVLKIGYPKITMALGEDLQPQLHTGVISSPHEQDWYVEYTASTDHGDSGGPVIETESRKLVAVVKGTFSGYTDVFVGEGPRAIRDFCAKAGVQCGSSEGGPPAAPLAAVNWGNYGPSFSIAHLTGLRASARCVRVASFYVWGLRIANNYDSTIALDLDVVGTANGKPNYSRVTLPNDTLYRVGPYLLNARCGTDVWVFHQKIVAQGKDGPPSHISPALTSRDPGRRSTDVSPQPVVGPYLKPWTGIPNWPDVGVSIRCIDLAVPSNTGQYIWQARFTSRRAARIQFTFKESPKVFAPFSSYAIPRGGSSESAPYLTNIACGKPIPWSYGAVSAL